MVESSSPFQEHPFWCFSLRIYGIERIKDECLRLQDSYGLNVNILLYCAWQAYDKRLRLPESTFSAIAQKIEGWHKKVEALRNIRRTFSQIRLNDAQLNEQALQKVKNIELASEYIEQTLLASVQLPPLMATDRIAPALRGNLQTYITFLGIADRDCSDVLADFMLAEFKSLDEAQ